MGGGVGEQAEATVLVVDDDQLLRSTMRNVLEWRNYRVLEAANPLDALAVLRSAQHVDLVISDLHMPGTIGGEQFVNQARLLRPGLTVMFVTGHPGDLSQESVAAPTTPVMAKPFRLQDFLGQVAALISRNGGPLPSTGL